MARRLISSGSTFEKSIGYSRAVVDGDWVFVSGTTGYDYSDMTIEDDVVAQCEQALFNIGAALKQAGATFADVVRVHYLMTDAAEFEKCWPAMGKVFGDVRPAATMMAVGLADAKMKIEIEVTALKRKPAPRKKQARKKKVPARRKK
jgi:enamine deaminase RidA (YjgF/YER057c/UK114 family)